MDSQIIEKYIIAIQQFQETRFQRISEEEFAKIAIDTGLTPSEMRAVKAEHTRLSAQGEAYHKSQNYEEAILLLEQALAIEPYNLQNHLLIVDSYKNLYLALGDVAHLAEGIQYCKRGLALDPTQTYFAQVQTEMQRLQQQRQRQRTSGFWTLGSTLVSVPTAVLVLWHFIASLAVGNLALSDIFGHISLFVGVAVLLLVNLGVFIWWLVCLSQTQATAQKLRRVRFKGQNMGDMVIDKILDYVIRFLK